MLKKIATYIIGTAGVFGAVWGVYSAVDKITDNQDDIIEMQEEASAERQFIMEDLSSIHDTLDRQANNDEELKDGIETLEWAIRNIHTFSENQLEEILNREFARDREYNRIGDVQFLPIE